MEGVRSHVTKGEGRGKKKDGVSGNRVTGQQLLRTT